MWGNYSISVLCLFDSVFVASTLDLDTARNINFHCMSELFFINLTPQTIIVCEAAFDGCRGFRILSEKQRILPNGNVVSLVDCRSELRLGNPQGYIPLQGGYRIEGLWEQEPGKDYKRYIIPAGYKRLVPHGRTDVLWPVVLKNAGDTLWCAALVGLETAQT